MIAAPHAAAATLPPAGLAGLDPAWSRLVTAPSADGDRTWHLLDNGVSDPSLTLLCVHGNPSWSYLFRQLVRDAPADVRVVAVDQLDMGFSERTGTVRRLATRVDDLCALTDELGLDGPVVTVAHDWGGPISLGWAQRHVEQLAGIVLMNTAVHQPKGSPAPNIIRLVRSRPMLNNVTTRTTAFIRGALEMSDNRPGADVRRGFLAPYDTAARRAAIAEFVADIPLQPDHPSAAALDGIAAGLDGLADTPALLLWGSADKVFSDLYLHDLERRLPHADVHRYPKAGHFVSEDTDAIGAVIDWVGGLGGGLATRDAGTEPSSLLRTHGELGDKIAVAEMTGEQVTFEQFRDLVDQTAAGLAGSGVAAGDRVALMIPPGIELAVALSACWHASATVVLIDSGLGPRGMSEAIKAADPDHLIGIPKAMAAARALRWPGHRISTTEIDGVRRKVLGIAADLPSLRIATGSLPRPPRASDVAAIAFTSGATGPSKGVVYTHRQLAAQRDAIASLYEITSDDRLVAAFAPFALYGPLLGITSVVPAMDVAAPGTLTAAALGDAVARVDATLVFASPAALANVVRTTGGLTAEHRSAFEGVRLVLSAGAPVRPELLAAAAALFPNARACTPYGMTECLPVANIDLSEIAAASGGDGVCVGYPIAGVEVQIRPLDELGRATEALTSEPNVLGEIVVRAAHARDGYDRLWHTEYAASRPPGWHSTGDVGHLDEVGRLWVGGRLGDVIAGVDGPIAPVRLEQRIDALDGVALGALVGVGPAGVQQVVAVIEPTEPLGSPRLADLARHDQVRAVVGLPVVAVFEVPHLPVDRRHNSKIDRRRVAAWVAGVLAGGRLTAP